jgi:ankyrin repeat protein
MVLFIFFAGFLLTETADAYDHTFFQAQQKLKELGYDPGKPDGLWGRKTTKALKSFQRDNGLPVTGKLDQQTKEKLEIVKPASQSSLIDAVKINDIFAVNMILDAGVEVNSRDKLGETALHVAAVRGYPEIASMLIDKGADVNAKDKRGLSPLHAAAWRGYQEIVTLLLTKGADINAGSDDGVTALHTAALAGRKDTVALLIANGADINANNEEGITPLHAAALAGHQETVELLIAKGANVNAKNKNGFTPLDAASQKGYGPIVELLKKHAVQN